MFRGESVLGSGLEFKLTFGSPSNCITGSGLPNQYGVGVWGDGKAIVIQINE